MSTIKWSSGQGELCGEFYRAGWGIQSTKPKDSRNQKVKGQSWLGRWLYSGYETGACSRDIHDEFCCVEASAWFHGVHFHWVLQWYTNRDKRSTTEVTLIFVDTLHNFHDTQPSLPVVKHIRYMTVGYLGHLLSSVDINIYDSRLHHLTSVTTAGHHEVRHHHGSSVFCLTRSHLTTSDSRHACYDTRHTHGQAHRTRHILSRSRTLEDTV